MVYQFNSQIEFQFQNTIVFNSKQTCYIEKYKYFKI